MHEDFYRAFEDQYRGSREVIKKRLEVYLPFVLPLHTLYPDALAIDIGCGRGEWLELLTQNSIVATGVDSDSGMLDAAKEKNLIIELGDGIEYLTKQPSNSAIVVSAFHLVEHLSFDDLMALIAEAKRVLVEGGILILETPNPENIKVASETFYLDPTHIKPIPYNLLSFITQYNGYKRDKILRLQEQTSLKEQLYVNVGHIIEGVSPDYAIIAQKDGDQEIFSSINEPFSKEYGISPSELVEKFEARNLAFESQIDTLQNTLQEIRQENLQKTQQQQACIDKTILLVKVAQDSANNASVRANTAQDGVDFILKVANHAQKSADTAQDGVNYILTIVHQIQKSLMWNLFTPRQTLKKVFNKIKPTQKETPQEQTTEQKEETPQETPPQTDTTTLTPRANEIYQQLNKK